MKRFRLSALAGLLLSAGTAAAHSDDDAEPATRYRVHEIPAPDDARCEAGFQRITFARRLNEKARAAGYYFCFVATGDPAAPYVTQGARAFRWSRSSGPTPLPSLTTNPIETYARDINDFGTAVGWEVEERGIRAPLWPSAGGVADAIDPLTCDFFGLIFTRAEGINERGSIATSSPRIEDDGSCRLRWVLKLASGAEIVGPRGNPSAINNRNVMVGSSGGNAIKWSPARGEIVLASGGTAPPVQAFAWDINDHNEVVGFVWQFSDDFNCVLGSDAKFWAANGTERALSELPGAQFTVAYGINRRGHIVGYAQSGPACDPYDPSRLRAVIWRRHGVADLNTLIPRARARQIQLILASAINDEGQILARGIRPSEPRKPCPAFVFDPATGESVYDSSLMCQSEYSFLLTPTESD